MTTEVKPDFEKQPLLPAVVQDFESGEVLMLAYVNEEAYNLSLSTGFTHFFSRSRNRLWKKGEESGNVQAIKEVRIDCDNDTVLFKVAQTGAACHTGHYSCFYRNPAGDEVSPSIDTEENIYGKKKILDDLYEIIEQRKKLRPEGSYVVKLLTDTEKKTSLNHILEKVGEEAVETIIAAKEGNRYDIIYETADLIFHLFVMLSKTEIKPDDIYDELKRRYKG